MAYTEIYTENVTTLAGLFVYVANAVDIFIPMMLMSIFFIVALATHFTQLRTRGYSNFTTSLAVAGYLTAVVTVILSMIPDLVNGYVLTATIVIAIICTALMFVGRERD